MERNGRKRKKGSHTAGTRRRETRSAAGKGKKQSISSGRVSAARVNRLVHVAFDHPLSSVSENLSGVSSLVDQGSTQNFVISYDPSLGQAGVVIANYLLTACEYDYSRVQPLFGIVPSGL